eukprot:gene11460-13321_t
MHRRLEAQTASFVDVGDHEFTVPGGVTTLSVTLYGASGGDSYNQGYEVTAAGGLGASITADISVQPGEVLRITVGGAGTDMGPGGSNGGGDSCFSYPFGEEGGLGDGTYVNPSEYIPGGGGGQNAGGHGGSSCSAGTFGQGAPCCNSYGAAGGGGYWGGGAAYAVAGGGGSSYAAEGYVSSGYASPAGNGRATFSWTPTFTQSAIFGAAGEYPFTVPIGVTSLSVLLYGASGGDSLNTNYQVQAFGGKGGYIKANIMVQPGETLHIFVGGSGSEAGEGGGQEGGLGDGSYVAPSSYFAGGGGSQGEGGHAGSDCNAGEFGYGAACCAGYGAGGGGGYYGGGGAYAAAGGGGSSYASEGYVSSGVTASLGGGRAILTWDSAPTAAPSKAPTVKPTIALTMAPIVSPTLPPTNLPIISPTFSPTRLPTSVNPTMSPTLNPTLNPTFGPTNGPTVSPSTLPPSLTPTVAPTCGPTVAPTANPTAFPTALPTLPPSATPTVMPTLAPSIAPTLAPTVNPTMTPTVAPTCSPTCTPTAQPTLNPTLTPTANPRFIYSRSPSVNPTRSPTLSERSSWFNDLQTVLTELPTNDTSAVALRSTYYELDVASSSPLRVFGGCSAWSTAVNGDMKPAQFTHKVTSVTLKAIVDRNSNEFSESLVTPTAQCGDAAVATSIVSAMTGSAITTSRTFQCGADAWVVRHCSVSGTTGAFSPAVCVNCVDPCSAVQQCNLASSTAASTASVLAVSPCVLQQCSGDYVPATAIRVLSVGYANLEEPPSLVTASITSTKSTVQVTAQLSSQGSLSAAIYRVSAAVSAPTSVNAVVLQNVGASTNAANMTTLTFTGLDAITSYRVYFLTTSPVGVRSTLVDVLGTMSYIDTLCCKTVTGTLSATSAIERQAFSNILTLRLSSAPTFDMIVSIQLFAVNTTGTVSVYSQSLFPSSMYVPRIALASTVLRASLPSLPIGIYEYGVVLSGDAASEFTVEYTNNQNRIEVLSAFTEPPVPVLSFATFASDGSYFDAINLQDSRNPWYDLMALSPAADTSFEITVTMMDGARQRTASSTVKIFDALGANASSSYTVVVTQGALLNATEVQNFVASSLADASGDVKCFAVCDCEDSYYGGSDACEFSAEQLQQRQSSRALVVSGLQTLVGLENPDEQVFSNWVNSLSQASQVPSDMSDTTSLTVLSLVDTVTAASTVSVSPQTASSLLNAVNSVAAASTKSAMRRRLSDRRHRRLSSVSADGAATVAATRDVLNSVGA